MNRASLDLLFRPGSVAIIGVSAEPHKLGHRIVRNLVDTGFAGPIYPVHPRLVKIMDLPVYESVAALPEGVSLAVACVPRQAVLKVVEQCVRAKIGAVIVITAGFAEVDAEGAQIQQLIAAKARDAGFPIVGPNCVGVINTDPTVRLNTTFCSLTMHPGPVALCSQSGALGLLALAKGDAFHLGFSQFISVGNEADVSTADVLEYWGGSGNTKVVLLYLESISHAARFRETASRVGRIKPIIAIKAGREPAGQRAARSHTAALTSGDAAIAALFQQTGVVRAEGLDEMLDLATLFAYQPLPPGRRVGIVTNAGGPAVLCADACADAGLEVPVLSPELQNELAAFAPPPASVANPIDMLASAGPDDYRRVSEVLLSCNEVDAVVVIYVPVEMVANPEFVEAICGGVTMARARGIANRPVAACIMSKSGERIRLATPNEMIPCFVAPAAAARALGKAVAYANWRQTPAGTLPRFEDMDFERAREILAAPRARTEDGWLSGASICEMAKAAGLPMLGGAIALTSSEAADAAQRLGFPVVLKTASAQIVHKTDIGAVELDVNNADEVRAAFDRITERVTARSVAAAKEGVIVQPVCAGVELMIGATRDPQLGPVLAFGLGGTLVEIVGDIAHRVAPLTDRDASEMVRCIRGYRLLAGYRGRPPADVSAIEQLLLQVSRLVVELPELCELDLNPVVALPDNRGCCIVDARMRTSAGPIGTARGW